MPEEINDAPEEAQEDTTVEETQEPEAVKEAVEEPAPTPEPEVEQAVRETTEILIENAKKCVLEARTALSEIELAPGKTPGKVKHSINAIDAAIKTF